MLNAITNLWTARVLVIIGFIAGYGSVGSTFTHIGDDRFLPTHVWYHFFREGMGDVAQIPVLDLRMIELGPGSAVVIADDNLGQFPRFLQGRRGGESFAGG